MNTVTQKQTEYYPYFDFLRFTLASIVVLGHDHIFGEHVGLWEHAGNFSVQIFFALSGFLIGNVLINTSRQNLYHFYFNRSIRIWIPYFIALALIVIAGALHDHINGKWLEFVMYELSFVYNLFGSPQLATFKNYMPLQGTSNHFWSVNAEEQFYLIAPLLLVLANKKFGQHTLTWLILAVVAWYTQTYSSIVFGILSIILVKNYGEYYQNQKIKILLLIICLVSLYGFFCTLIPYDLIAPFCAISIVLLLAIKGNKNNLGAFLGGISYPLYLNHWIGVFVANALLKPFSLNNSLYRLYLELMINLVIAGILFMLIEKPILARRNALYTLSRGKIACYSAYVLVFTGITYGLTRAI